jgi:outer membrane receptor protein involved in Fe transport
MKNRFMAEGPRPLPAECNGTQSSLAPLIGLGFAVAILAAALAGAEEPEPADSAGDPESQETQSDPPAEPELGSEWEPSLETDIEEILIFGSESEATGDFQAADSVTGFSTDDLAALGAQTIADLASFTPNLEIVSPGATTPTFFIRGVGLNDFNSNSTGAVAIYQDDVAINAPALQSPTLFDVEAVNVLRGPQGTGLARNASAGAIKFYSRKPSGEFGGFVRSEFGNFDTRDFEGAVETPLFEDILSGRFAFRLSQRDGIMKNRCGNARAFGRRDPAPGKVAMDALGLLPTDPPWSICGEPVGPSGFGNPEFSEIPVGLPSRVNDIDNWGARGTLLFEPAYNISFLLNAHGSRRDEWSRLGQAYGTNGFYCLNGDIDNCWPPARSRYPNGSRIDDVLGGKQGLSGYQTQEVRDRLLQLAPCLKGVPGRPQGTCGVADRADVNAAKLQVAKELARELDSEPWAGDFNMCSPDKDINPDRPGIQCDDDTGKTKNDTWGAYLKGDIDLPWEMRLTSISGYDTYNRVIDIDLDYSPESVFHILTEDEGWQVTQDLRLQGQFGDEVALRWDIGSWFLREQLDVSVTNDLGEFSENGVGQREYTQDLWSAAGYASLAVDFWDYFTLDGGFRYNWEQKKLDFELRYQLAPDPFLEKKNETWDAPTGLVRLTYRFRDDTHIFWKYTRGWKPGTFNATSALTNDPFTGVPFANVSTAKPEEIDSFETGIRGSWFDDNLTLDFSFFYYSYSDYQIFTAQQFEGGQPEFVILNADDAEVYGAELDAVARPWEGAFINVRFGWLESQFLDFVQIQQEKVNLPGLGQVTVNRELQNTGNNLLNSPEYKVSLTAEQTLSIGGWGSVTVRYDVVWTDTTYYDATQGRGIPNVQNFQYLPEETIAQPDFWIHNLRVSYLTPDNKIEVAGWVRNFADKAYKTFAFDASTFNNTTIYNVGDPRTYGVTLIVNF